MPMAKDLLRKEDGNSRRSERSEEELITIYLRCLDEYEGIPARTTLKVGLDWKVEVLDASLRGDHGTYSFNSHDTPQYYCSERENGKTTVKELSRTKPFRRYSIQPGASIYYRFDEDGLHSLTEENGKLQSRLTLRWTEYQVTKITNQPYGTPLSPFIAFSICGDIVDSAKKLSVGDVQARIAEAVSIDDPNRIMLIAKNGLLRLRPLVGVDWQLHRLLQNSLCTRLEAVVLPPNQYLTVRGGGGTARDMGRNPQSPRRTYIIPNDRHTAHVLVGDVRWRICDAIFPTMKQNWDEMYNGIKESYTLALSTTLFDKDGNIFHGDSEHIQWGGRIEFRLPDDMVEAVADSETWLLLPTVTCSVCYDSKAVTEFPHRVTAGCHHGGGTSGMDGAPTEGFNSPGRDMMRTCKPCLAESIRSTLKERLPENLTCPNCLSRLAYEDVRLYAHRADFERYDTLLTRAAVAREFKDFHWCLGPGCSSGQIAAISVEGGCRKLRCYACKAVQCVLHNVPWHVGETCEQFDSRMEQRRIDEVKSRDLIQESSNDCPKCNRSIHKFEGCNHITCVCGQEWCYVCLATYVASRFGIIHCKHNQGCSERDLFHELGLDAQGNETPIPLDDHLPAALPDLHL